MRHAPWLLLLCLPLLPGTAPQPHSPATDELIGVVRDADGPLPNVLVRYKGDAFATFTDLQGRFRLPRPPSSRRLVAATENHIIGGNLSSTSPLSFLLKRIPAEDCEAYAWVEPGPDPKGAHNCANCHQEAYREWSQSGHARSVANPRFRNLYDGTDASGNPGVGWNLLGQHPDGAGVCASCHAPTVGFNDDLRDVRGVAARGVHCDYCHKVADVEPTARFGFTHGRYGLKLRRPAEGQLFFGPLADVDRGEDVFAPLYKQSRYCASCHEGVVFGVPVYTTYSEWLESPARAQGKECQTCHMTPTGKLTNLAPGKGGIRRDPHTLSNHRFFAGSQEAMLQKGIAVAAAASALAGDVRVTLEIRADGAGHRVPTGFIDRHLLLVVEAFDAADRPVTLSRGDALPPLAGKTLAGKPGRLYARRLTDADGRSPAPFWLARPDVIDTRLQPGQVERPEFVFAVAARKVRLRLLYRRFWDEVAKTKGWPDDDIVIVDRTLHVPALPPNSK